MEEFIAHCSFDRKIGIINEVFARYGIVPAGTFIDSANENPRTGEMVYENNDLVYYMALSDIVPSNQFRRQFNMGPDARITHIKISESDENELLFKIRVEDAQKSIYVMKYNGEWITYIIPIEN